jgi:HSP20 family molecular chaperone IbpA
MDVVELPDHYRIVCDVPGISADDIKVEVNEGACCMGSFGLHAPV